MVKDTIILGVVFIVAILVVGGLVYTQAPKLWDFFNDFIGESNSFSSIGLKLTYADGTETDNNLEDFSLFPLTIYDQNGAEVTAILPYVATTLEHTISDTVTSWTYRVTDYDLEVTNLDTGASAFVIQDETRTLEQASNWQSGQREDLGLNFWSSGEFSSLLSTHGELGNGGSMQAKFTVDIQVTLHTHATQYTETGSGSTTWTFVWNTEGITSLTVIVGTDRIY